MRPHRRQPTRLPRPWDSPGKNTGVGCLFRLQCMQVKSQSEVAQSPLPPPSPPDPSGSVNPWLIHFNVLQNPQQYCKVIILQLIKKKKRKKNVKSLSRVWLLATPWTAAYQAPLSMGLSRREYWSGVPLPSPLKNLAFIKLSKGLYYPSCFSTWTYRCASNTGTRGGDYNLEWFILLHDVHV